VELTSETKKLLIRNKERTKDRYDQYVNPQTFKSGDFVWLRKESSANDRTHALNLPFEGPYKIVNKVSDVNYRIVKRNKHMVVHANRLKFSNINVLQNDD
jgi:hypothetical protein